MIETVAKEFNELSLQKSKDIYTKVSNHLQQVNTFFEEKAKVRNRNFRFYRGNQWTDAERREFYAQNRQPYIFNEIHHKIEHITGSQVQTRLDAKAVPRERRDSSQAELLNFILKWVEQVTNIEGIETQVFRDSTVGAVSCAVVRWDKYDLAKGMPVVEQTPSNEMFWDINATKSDLSDARWVARVTSMYRHEAKEMFPESQEIIDKATVVQADQVLTFNLNLDDHRYKVMQTLGSNMQDDKDYDILQVIEFYETKKIKQFLVGDEITDTLKVFDEYVDAKDFFMGLQDKYIEIGEPLDNPDGTSRLILTDTTKDGVWQTFIVGSDVIENNLTDLNVQPFVFNFAFTHDGDYWAPVDNLISPQILVNKSFSEWDYQLGTSTKNMITVMPSLLKKDFGMESLRREMSKTGPMIPVVRHDAIQQHPSSQPQTTLFDNISFGIQRMNDYAGGKNALGLQENAAESGRAVIARAEQGGLSRLSLFDNLKEWRKGVTERIIWWIKNYMTAGQIIKVIGDDQSVQFLDLDDGTLDTLKEIQLDVHVEEASKADTVNERYFTQLKELFAVMPGVPPEVVMQMMLPFSSLPETKKEELQGQLQGYQQYMQEQEKLQKEQKLLQQAQDQVAKRHIKEELERSDELELAEKEMQRKEKNVQTQLGKVEQLRADYQSGLNAHEKEKMMGDANTPEEMANIQKASITSALLK